MLVLLAQGQQAARAAGTIAGFLCAMGTFLVIGTLIGAVILRTACWLYNTFVGGRKTSRSVPEPDFGKAMGIAFVTWLVNVGVSFAIGFVVGGTAAAMGQARSNAPVAIAQLISIPPSLLVLAGLITAMLPTTFGRALLVALIYVAISLMIAAIIGLIVVGVMLSMGSFNRS